MFVDQTGSRLNVLACLLLDGRCVAAAVCVYGPGDEFVLCLYFVCLHVVNFMFVFEVDSLINFRSKSPGL